MILVHAAQYRCTHVCLSYFIYPCRAAATLISVLCAVCVLDGLVEQRNRLIDEIHSVKEERELAIGALNVAHELSMQSVNERCERHLATQLAAGQ